MEKKTILSREVFLTIDYVILVLSALICLLPMINVLALSFSSSTAAAANEVKLWPVDFTLASYKYAITKPEFIQSLVVSAKRVIVGVPINMVLTICVAYPLSKDNRKFHFRQVYVWFFVITMIFNGGLIPTYMVVKSYHLIDSIWALVLPIALPVFNVILLLNFFKGLPKEIEEAAFIDGAGHITSLVAIYLPLSAPSLATISLFALVTHWNSWFDGLIFMNKTVNYPLQTYLQSLVVSHDLKLMNTKEMERLALINDRTLKASQIFLAAVPVLIVYPFLQKYFTKGIVLGSVKG